MYNSALAGYLYCGNLLDENSPIDDHNQFASKAQECLLKLIEDLDSITDSMTEEEIQSIFYEAGKLHFKENLRQWFAILYWSILKEKTGPRFGAFTKLMGPDFIITRIHKALYTPFA
jgi:lysyl-tRNA synthetase class I